MKLRDLWRSTDGNFAMMFAVVAVPLLLSAGMGIDYSRMLHAKQVLQDVADSASLSLASSKVESKAAMEEQIRTFIAGNLPDGIVDSVTVKNVAYSSDSYDVTLAGTVPTTFMGIAGFHDLPIDVSSMAVRDIGGSVEVALVLDNTTSMKELDDHGMTRISALRSAASKLVSDLHSDDGANVRISVVPYADYVNVGTAHRDDDWVSVGDDYSTTSTPPANCGVPVTKTYNYCAVAGPKQTCTRVKDGVVETYSCNGACAEWATKTQQSTPSCNVSTRNYTWFGCVGTRVEGSLRLSDASPEKGYPGRLEQQQHCPTQILPLTASSKPVLEAISQMQAGNGYDTDTYIPSGLVWGLNTLSASAPFTQGEPYDSNNEKPRKVLVLMTDGQNTMYYTTPDGMHKEMKLLGTEGTQAIFDADQVSRTRSDTLSLCKNIKSHKIEIFSIAFAVDSDDSKSLLQACASDEKHYYDAHDSISLSAAFSDIAGALTQVRLAR